ncbi:MAG: tRNA (N(6)-L-threonylcarbamoyladenosine(37)-C(2))-methylthiotransferase MtaB [Bacteroidales bacterium]|nr:tRNA (N(6)-L-threonylcarbamoyladenosine(37)-C(2))-methylthiotransferase MtaB [Bacteroidales bacterium]
MKPPSIAFHHFGCKVNFAEASTLSRQFADKGYLLTGFHDKADIYVISSCVVTATAEKKCRAAIRQAHTLNPDARIAVIGCFPELKAGEVTKMEGVDIVLGHQGKFNLLEEIEKRGTKDEGREPSIQLSSDPVIQNPASRIQDPGSFFIPSYSVGDRTRSFLKIQDGCDYHCSYCAIPLARGKSRSDTVAHILDEAREIVDTGVKEIVLTGVNIGDFGKHNGENLFQLLSALESEIRIPRIRISSIEPDLLHDEIIRLVASSEKFLPHFHIPLQSGCDNTLSVMKRKYTTALYSSRVEKILKEMPHACIAADVIVGFPGESAADFEETRTFLEKLQISYLHVFSYSKRENTLASRSAEMIPKEEKKRRSEELHQLSDIKKRAFYQSNKGREAQVLFESDNKNGMMHGFTENYIKVKTAYDPSLINEIRTVKLVELEEDMNYMVKW